MSIIFEDYCYESLSEFSDSSDVKVKVSNLEFAHPVDSTIIKVLETGAVKKVFSDAVNLLVSTNYGLMLSSGIPINRQNFPELSDILYDCCQTLSIDMPYTIVTNEVPGTNAFATGTDDFSFVAISSLMPKIFSLAEKKFIIAHECGHIALGHMVYHTAMSIIADFGQLLALIGPIVAKTISLPLNTWSRCSEITADRAGLICCRDLRTAQMALVKIVGGFTDIDDLDIDLYIEQSRAAVSSHGAGKYAELFKQHPLIFKRLKAMELFYNSKMYHSITGESAGDKKLLSDSELNKRVSSFIKII